MAERHRRSTTVLLEAIERDWPTSLAVMPLPHAGGASTRPYRPSWGDNPVNRIAGPRALAQLHQPSARARAEMPGGPVWYEEMAAQRTAARTRTSTAISPGRVQPHRRVQSIFG